MADELVLDSTLNKEDKYEQILPQLKALTAGEDDLISNTANVMAVLKETFQFLWVGVYFVKQDRLQLGPFQGPLACTRIAFGKGVCGTCWSEEKTIMVPDVELFEGHIACSSLSKSEIVVPFFDKQGEMQGVIDVDSEQVNQFDATDEKYLTKIAELLGTWYD